MKGWIAGIVLLLALCQIFYLQRLSNQRLEKELENSRSTLAQQVFQFQRINKIAAAAGQYKVNIQAHRQEKEIVYRTIFKTEPCANQPVPGVIADRLLEYTRKLRSSALSAVAGDADYTAVDPITAGQLTYQQAVLWIDPLLTTLDEANARLDAIRRIEEGRQRKKQG